MNSQKRRIIVIGGGITGLSSCWYLQSLAESPLDITLIEAADSLGGKMQTRQAEMDSGKIIIDAGPELFVTRKPEAWNLSIELGLEGQIVDPGSETKNMYVIDGGKPKKIPLSPPAFITSDLLSIKGKLRMVLEPFIPAKTDYEDESLASFVTRRLGREALDKMIGPVLAGIYNTDPETQSIMTTSPVMREMEREQGGLFRGALARMRARKNDSLQSPRRPQFMTYQDGAQELVDELEKKLNVRILLGAKAQTVTDNSGDFVVELSRGGSLEADGVILAVPANQSSRMLQEDWPEPARLLGEIKHENIGTAALIFENGQMDLPYQINGLMIPRRENRRIDAVTWTSNKPIDRAPEGYEMIRIFFGGSDPSVVSLPEKEVIAVILEELEDIFGIAPDPLMTEVFCWPDSFPQAHVGHLNKVDEIEASLPDGLWVTGSSYRGIGIPDCIRQGRETALKTIDYLNSLSD
jgi:oxygen-dependent protoporphyrinogen oxidase